jgi:uncharacterized protein YukE
MHEIRVDPSALWETGGVLGAAAERVDAARHGRRPRRHVAVPARQPGGRLPRHRSGGAAGLARWRAVILADAVAAPGAVAVPAGDPAELRAAASTLSASAEALDGAAATAEAVIGAAVPTAWAGTAARSCGDAQQRAVADCRALVRAMRSWSMRTSRPCVLPGSNRRASWRCYATTRSPTQQTWRGLLGT